MKSDSTFSSYVGVLAVAVLFLVIPGESTAKVVNWLPFDTAWTDTATTGTVASPDLTVDVVVTHEQGTPFAGYPQAFSATVTDPTWSFDNTNLPYLAAAMSNPSGCRHRVRFDFTNSGGLPAGGSIAVVDVEFDSTVQILPFRDGSPVQVAWDVRNFELDGDDVPFPSWNATTATLTGPGSGSSATLQMVFLISDQQLDAIEFVGINQAGECGDAIGYQVAAQTVPLVPCPAAPDPACDSGFEKASLTLKEKPDGKERMIARWSKGPAMTGTDYGNPTTSNGTAYTMCVYGDAAALTAEYSVNRDGEACGKRACWRSLGKDPGDPKHRGYSYRDKSAATDGISAITLKAGASGKSGASVRGANNSAKNQLALPTGVATALQGSMSVTIQLFGSDAPDCISATLLNVLKDDGEQYKARK